MDRKTELLKLKKHFEMQERYDDVWMINEELKELS